MSSMHKLKAYFGLADDESDPYADDPYESDYAESSRRDAPHRQTYERDSYERDSYERDTSGRPAAQEQAQGYRSGAQPVGARAPGATARISSDTRHPTAQDGRGALAVEVAPEPARRTERANPFAEEGHPLGTISTLHPRTYNEARTIGERYREGNPVIMNLTEMSDSDAKRLVDFAAGLAFAMHGAIDKVTSKVFLLSPPDVDVSAEDRRRIAETGFYRHG